MRIVRSGKGAVALASITAVTAGATGYGIATYQEARNALARMPAPISSAHAANPQDAVKRPLYYQDPDGKPEYSATPKKTADGRDFVPVYEDAPPSAKAALPVQSANNGKGRILYYRNPMGLPDTSPVPKKDSMGMAYIPVYENEAPSDSGLVQVSPGRLQMLGVKTAPVELRPALTRTVRAAAVVQADETDLADVTTKFDGVVEKMFVSTTGAKVHAGQPLAQVWIQIPDKMMQAGPDLVTREADYVFALKQNNPEMIAQSEGVLRDYGIPESAIAEMRRTGRATRSVTITAPRNGEVLDKPAIEGMHFNTGDPLFKIADLSTVWLIANVQEQDLGVIRLGAPVHINFVAYPGHTFSGKVGFIYPTMDAATRTGRVRIVIPNPDGRLRISMYASVAIDTQAASGEKIVAVPDSAIIDSGTRQVVLIAKGEGRFEPRAIRIGARGDGYTQILDGLKPGEEVVVGANFLIDAESNLRAALSSFAANSPNTGSGAQR